MKHRALKNEIEKPEVLKGADLNSKISGNGADTPADQQALKNGYNYNRVGWKK